MKGKVVKFISLVIVLLVALQTSCVVVGGYSDDGGWFIWPWGLVISAVFIGLFLLLRRRRR